MPFSNRESNCNNQGARRGGGAQMKQGWQRGWWGAPGDPLHNSVCFHKCLKFPKTKSRGERGGGSEGGRQEEREKEKGEGGGTKQRKTPLHLGLHTEGWAWDGDPMQPYLGPDSWGNCTLLANTSIICTIFGCVAHIMCRRTLKRTEEMFLYMEDANLFFPTKTLTTLGTRG